jgi:hypothetical protein
LAYAEDAGIAIPIGLKNNLSAWIDTIQNDQGAADDAGMPSPDGGSGYTIASNWVNTLKTGNLLSEMALVGDSLADQRVGYALTYLGVHWYDLTLITGWGYDATPDDSVAQYQAMYTIMKGLETMGVPNGGVPGVLDWYQDLADVIVAQQMMDGSWPGSSPTYVTTGGGSGPAAGPVLSTVWALLVLERIAPEPPVVGGEVYAVDVPAASVADVGTESGISALWIGLGAALIVAIGGGVFVLKRQRAN